MTVGKRRNIYLTEIEFKRLQEVSKKTGFSGSMIIRIALKEFYERFTLKEKRHSKK